jgi:hypothetical protein
MFLRARPSFPEVARQLFQLDAFRPPATNARSACEEVSFLENNISALRSLGCIDNFEIVAPGAGARFTARI